MILKIKELLKIRKYKIILLLVLSLIITGSSVAVINTKNTNKKDLKEFTYIRTVTLSKSRLMDTVVASGIIESQVTSSITSNINGTSVSKINFNVGDYVNEGDIIIELDSTNLNKQISSQKEKIEQLEENLQSKYDSAYDNYSDSKDTYEATKSSLNSANENLSSINSLIESYQNDYNEKTSLVEQAYKDSFEDETVSISGDDKVGYTMNPDTYDYANKLNDQMNSLSQLENAKAAYHYDEALKAYNDASNAFSQAKSKYEQAESSYEEASDSLNDGIDKSNLNDLYTTVSDYKLKAKTSGQITNLNAVLGGNVNGTLVTIQDTNKLKLSLIIDEYDILKLELGMKAQITTDASDKVYEGELSQISPTAISSGGFEIEVIVTSEDVTDLLIGMNAEVTIIISKTNENFNVPTEAIEKKEDGTKVIYVQNDENEFVEFVIETGSEAGYYTEIFSDELIEGMKVRASANIEEATVTVIEDEDSNNEQLFDFGNMMPGQNRGFDSNRGGFNQENGFNSNNRQRNNQGFNRGN